MHKMPVHYLYHSYTLNLKIYRSATATIIPSHRPTIPLGPDSNRERCDNKRRKPRPGWKKNRFPSISRFIAQTSPGQWKSLLAAAAIKGRKTPRRVGISRGGEKKKSIVRELGCGYYARARELLARSLAFFSRTFVNFKVGARKPKLPAADKAPIVFSPPRVRVWERGNIPGIKRR